MKNVFKRAKQHKTTIRIPARLLKKLRLKLVMNDTTLQAEFLKWLKAYLDKE